jgi:hypothetical protein
MHPRPLMSPTKTEFCPSTGQLLFHPAMLAVGRIMCFGWGPHWIAALGRWRVSHGALWLLHVSVVGRE